MHALPLRLHGQAIGALNLFRRTPGVLPAFEMAGAFEVMRGYARRHDRLLVDVARHVVTGDLDLDVTSVVPEPLSHRR